jgi:hypothetical protein
MSMKKEDIGKISEKEWLDIKENIRTSWFQSTFMALMDVVDGQGAIDTMRPYARLCGQAFALNMIKLFNIQGDDIDKIGDVCLLNGEAVDYDMNEIERTKQRIVSVGGTKCHWRDNPKEACIAGHEMLFNEICHVINPEYECRFTQMITKGDPICSWIIEKKKK